ncbi:hypothetical protein PYCCODRAFT_1183001 [Trametes coccinea BRFM310]|uniref:Uncharacterized protein n=1 Tax=Trametes coccinea (strain BRFM310) TaxID=1353009 RepID=A0A1Y2IXG5_TRAC3|nr:hypothetical protein PYCCODRAFT_1183001 [Trametes coccinea BRFM310]
MSPLQTRAQARRKSIAVTADGIRRGAPTDTVKASKRRDTLFVIEQRGRRIALAERTVQVNTGTQRIAAASRKPTCHPGAPRWVEVESESLPPVKDVIKRDLAVQSQQTPRVRWARRNRIFSWSQHEDTPRPPKAEKPLTPILVHRDPSRVRLLPPMAPTAPQAEEDPEDMRGRPRVHRDLVNTPPSKVTVRSRTRSRTQSIAPVSAIEEKNLPSGTISDMLTENVCAPRGFRRNAVSLESIRRPASAASNTGSQSRPRSLTRVHMLSPWPTTLTSVEDDLSISVLVIPPTPRAFKPDETGATSLSAQQRLHPSLATTSRSFAQQPHRLNKTDQYILRFGVAYAVLITLLFMPIFGLW